MEKKEIQDIGAQTEISSPGKEAVSTQFSAWERVEAQLEKLRKEKIVWNKDVLNEKQKQMLRKLIEAAKLMDEIFLRQVSIRNVQIRADLEQSKDPKADVIKQYFNINFGPYDRFDGNRPFINVPLKPPGATFYPQNMTKNEFNAWIETHPKEKKNFISNYTVITRGKEGLKAIPYSEYYKPQLEKAAKLLNEASLLSENKSLAKFLSARSKSFLDNDYYKSELLWLEIKDNLIDVTIGPYETYEDELFGYKASFEAFICLKDPEASNEFEEIEKILPELEKQLPYNSGQKSLTSRKNSPIIVVDVIFTAGDAKAGVQTIAFNLPNDERVRAKKGSKKVLLRNFINAKFDAIVLPIAELVIAPPQHQYISKEAFFKHVLLHEISHGSGPGFIKKENKTTEVRIELKDLYSPIEEAKADALGLMMAKLLQEKGIFPQGMELKIWTTFVASIFRTIRFGINEAHGKANALILNFLIEKGAIKFDESLNTYSINFDLMQEAITQLVNKLLSIEAEGNYEEADKILRKYATVSDTQKNILTKINKIPVDIVPVFDLEF